MKLSFCLVYHMHHMISLYAIRAVKCIRSMQNYMPPTICMCISSCSSAGAGPSHNRQMANGHHQHAHCRASSLGKLAWKADKLQGCMRAAMTGPPGLLSHAPAWLLPVTHLRPLADGSPAQEDWLQPLWRGHLQLVLQQFQRLLEAQLEVSGRRGPGSQYVLHLKWDAC